MNAPRERQLHAFWTTARPTRRHLLRSAALAGFAGLANWPSPPEAAAQQTVLKLMTLSEWGDQWLPVIDAFRAKHPEIQIDQEKYPFRQLFEIIEVRMQGKSQDVDILCVDVPLVTSYSLRGYLRPLDEYFKPGEIESVWVPASLEAGRYNGQLMAAPLNSSTQFMYVNRTLFAQAGVQLPVAFARDQEVTVDEVVAGRWTWEQVVEAAKALTTDTNGDGQTDIWGFIFDQVSRPYQILALPESLEQPSISPDGLKTEGYLDSPKWLQVAKFYYDLFNGDKPVSPKGIPPVETPELFASGKVAIFVGGEWNIPRFEQAKDLDYAIAAHPYFAGGRVATPTGSWHLGVPAYSQHPAEAGAFVKYVTADPEGSRIWFESRGQFPATTAFLQLIETDPAFAQFPKVAYRLGAYEARNTAVPRPKTPGYLEFEDILNQTLEDIRNGADPEQAMRAAVRRIDRALEKYR